ncbi:hypothetical protein M4D79_00845 [Mycolicibacterium novocastrense]|nr:hypothetical protein M4D79_00845 [Mycolicibacterium novocastrense]
MAGRHGRHGKRSRSSKKLAAIGAATATATALTIGAAPLPKPSDDAKTVVDTDVNLAAAVNQWPGPDEIPDLTLGLGPAVYDLGQVAAEVLIRLVVENFNLAVLAQAAGADPESVLNNLLGGVLGEIPPGLLADVVGAIPIDVPGVVGALVDPLGVLTPGVEQQLSNLLAGSLPETIGGLLGLLGLDLSDPFNLSNLPGPVNVITAGPVFTVLKLLGVDLGWVPGLPRAIAEEVNKTPYLDVEVSLESVLRELEILNPVLDLLNIPIPDIDAVEVRVPVVPEHGAWCLLRWRGIRADRRRPGESAGRGQRCRASAPGQHHDSSDDPAAQPGTGQRRHVRPLLSSVRACGHQDGDPGDRSLLQRGHPAARHRPFRRRCEPDPDQARRDGSVRRDERLRRVAEPILVGQQPLCGPASGLHAARRHARPPAAAGARRSRAAHPGR